MDIRIIWDEPFTAPQTRTVNVSHIFDTGDIVRIGQGYQRWTITQRTGDTLVLQSDPSRSAIAGSSARTKEVDVGRVTLLRSRS